MLKALAETETDAAKAKVTRAFFANMRFFRLFEHGSGATQLQCRKKKERSKDARYFELQIDDTQTEGVEPRQCSFLLLIETFSPYASSVTRRPRTKQGEKGKTKQVLLHVLHLIGAPDEPAASCEMMCRRLDFTERKESIFQNKTYVFWEKSDRQADGWISTGEQSTMMVSHVHEVTREWSKESAIRPSPQTRSR